MNRLASWIALISTSCLLLGGCGRPRAITPSDRNLLLLHERIAVGSTPADVRKAFPSVGAPRTEAGRTELKTDVELMGTLAVAEFNFQSDSLYGVFFHPERLPPRRGDALFDSLVAFYSARYGQASVADGADDPYFVKSRQWRGEGFEVVVTNSIEGDMRQLGWGYQVPINLRGGREE